MIKNILQALSGFITTLERQKYVSTEGLEGVLGNTSFKQARKPRSYASPKLCPPT